MINRRFVEAMWKPLIFPAIATIYPNSRAEDAHNDMMRFSREYARPLNWLLRDSAMKGDISLSIAAGFDKNGLLDPKFPQLLGMDRHVIGTVTGDEYKGNEGNQRIRRLRQSEGMWNFLGLPGIGAEMVREELEKSFENGGYGIPLTINFMSTPKKQGQEMIDDMKKTLQQMSGFSRKEIDRFEVNLSCPNTHDDSGKDTREEAYRLVDSILEQIVPLIGEKELYIKISPDSTDEQIKIMVDLAAEYGVNGITQGNTSTQYKLARALESEIDGIKVGGISGKPITDISLGTTRRLVDIMRGQGLEGELKVIACGGINSREVVEGYKEEGIREFQVFTPLIYEGPRLVRELKGL